MSNLLISVPKHVKKLEIFSEKTDQSDLDKVI